MSGAGIKAPYAPVGGAGPRPIRLAALVVTYQRPDHLARTIARLRDEGADPIVVVDNASRDRTPALLAAEAGITLITRGTNGGGAAGFEDGLRHLHARADWDWCVVMDDDARPRPGALDAFRAADLTWADAVAAAVEFPDGTVCDMNRPSWDPFRHWSVFRDTFLALRLRDGFHMTPDMLAPGAPWRRIDSGSFVGLFLSRRALEVGGYPDGRMFLYGDDVLHTLRMTRAGVRLVAMPEIRFEHECSAVAAADGRLRPSFKVYYNHRNLMQVYAETSGALWALLMPAALVKWAWKARRYPAGAARRAYWRHTRAAVRDYLAGTYDRAPRPAPEEWERTPAG